MSNLSAIYEIFGYFQLVPERLLILDMITRILELSFSYPEVFTRAAHLLPLLNDTPPFSTIKVSIMRTLASMASCSDLLNCSDPAIRTDPRLVPLLNKCVETLKNPLLVASVAKELDSPVTEVRGQALYTLGIFAANHVGMESFLFGQGGLQVLTSRIQPSLTSADFNVMANWCVCLVCKNYVGDAVAAKVPMSIVALGANLDDRRAWRGRWRH